MENGVILADYAPDGCPLATAKGDAGCSAKRRHYWVRQDWARQAASLLDPASGVVTGSGKRRRNWIRQAAS